MSKPEQAKSENAAKADNLENHFLVAMPQLHDPYFSNTITYLWKHSEDGAMGIIVNKPSRMRISELLHEMRLQAKDADLHRILHKERVLTGGPVEKHKGFILHESGHEWSYTLPLTDQVSLSMSKDILEDIAIGKGPSKYLIAMGCAGWEAGQLEEEISKNVWLTVPATPELLFSRDYENKPGAAVALLGLTMSQLWSPSAGHQKQ